MSPIEIFRAIREQGRDRCADLYRWVEGELTYYNGQTHPRVDFALELEIASLMITGLEATRPEQSPAQNFRERLGEVIHGRALTETDMRILTPAPIALRVARLLVEPLTLRDVLAAATSADLGSTGDVLRALEVLHALGVAKSAK
jgi:hypothetical protein